MTNFMLEVERVARENPKSAALIAAGRVLAYSEVNQAVWQTATVLHRRGVRAGAVVAHTFGDPLVHALCMLAVCRLGATALCLPASDPPPYRAEIARRTGATVHLVGDALVAADGLLGITMQRVDLLDRALPIDRSVADDDPVAPALLIVGSGSMGRKKLIPVRHKAMMARAYIFQSMLDMTAHDRIACLSSLDYAMANQRLFEALILGAAYVVFEPQDVDPVAACRRDGVSVLHASVFHVFGLLKRGRMDPSPLLGFLRVLRVGSALVPDALRRQILSELSPNLYIRLGTNDFGPATIARPEDIRSTPGTVGRPGPGVEVRLLRPDGMPVASGEIGQIWLRSPGMIDAFMGDPEANRALFRDGWFTPRDLGRMTEDGQLIYCGRTDEMMIFNGINVYPAEIEQAMCQHPAVSDVACLPLKSMQNQDVPVCAVALREGQAVDDEELMRFAHDRLGPQRPRLMVVVPSIIRTENGKLDRPALGEQVMRAIGKRSPKGM